MSKPTALLALAVLILAGCPEVRDEPVEPRLKAIRTYGWPATVVDPAPDWHPSGNRLLARSLGGFSILEEGGPGERRFAANDRGEAHFPRWINGEQFVYGPGWNARRGADGTVSTPSEGLTVVTMGENAPLSREKLSDRGFMPRPSEGLVVAQEGNRILIINAKGRVSEFGEGFDAEPQPDGPGLCWRDIPAFEPDWWTGLPGPGTMYIRWRHGETDALPLGVQAAWTRRGGVLATVLSAPAPAGQPWWAGGTTIVHLAGPGAKPEPARRAARDPAPHPRADLLAWTGDDGGVWIGPLQPDGWCERIAPAGSRPRWSSDGLRLCWLEPPAQGAQVPGIRVAVLAVK